MKKRNVSEAPASEWEYARIAEVAEAYHFNVNTTRKLAEKAGAFRKISRRLVLIDMRRFRTYIDHVAENNEAV